MRRGRRRDLYAAAERIQDREHLGEAHGGFPAFKLDKEAEADTGGRGQLILAQALGKPSLTDDGTNLFDNHGDVPDREYYQSVVAGSPAEFPIGNTAGLKPPV